MEPQRAKQRQLAINVVGSQRSLRNLCAHFLMLTLPEQLLSISNQLLVRFYNEIRLPVWFSKIILTFLPDLFVAVVDLYQ